MTQTVQEILDSIANGFMIYGVCDSDEKRCWEHTQHDIYPICRICFLTGWHHLFQKAAQDDYDESKFVMQTRIERVLRSFANQQIIISNVKPNLDRQQFVDHYKHKIAAAYEARLRNEFLCELAGRPKPNDW